MLWAVPVGGRARCPARCSAGRSRRSSCRVRRSTGGRGQRDETGEGGSELGCPRPVPVDAEPESALSAGESGGDVQQSIAQCLGFGPGEAGVVQEQGLAKASRSTAIMVAVSHAALMAKDRLGSRPSPVSRPVRMRSSTRA